MQGLIVWVCVHFTVFTPHHICACVGIQTQVHSAVGM